MPYTIDATCVCCHNCRMECPASAINYVKAKYEIDTEKCIECGHCAEVCHISAIRDTSAPVVKPQPHEPRRLSCDLVVVGAGGSGLIAAVKAAQISRKKVIVLEKAKKPGGNTNLAHGFMVFYSKWQQQAGEPDNRDDYIRRAMERVSWRLNPRILHNAIYATGPFFDWLAEMGDVEESFELTERFGMKMVNYKQRKYANLLCRDPSIGPGWAGTFVIRKMLEQCEKLGIQVLTEHAAKKLFTDQNGRITGVLAEDPGGETQIDCKACIVATGGFGRSDEKLKKYFPQFFEGGTYIHRFSVPTNTGDGMDLGAAIGAAIPEEHLCVNMFGPAHHPFGYCIYRIMQQPEVVYINMNGKRWIDETAGLIGSRYIFAKQPQTICWAIVDEPLLERLGQRLIENPPDGNDLWILKDYRKEIEEELKLDTPAKRDNTLEGLSRQIGVFPQTFVEEIERYNEFCARGRDEDFFKHPKYLVPITKPPFYAFYGKRFSEGAFGGLKVNEHTQVLDKHGKVIPGLYATGDAASALLLRDQLGVISELTWAVASGYIAGCHVGEALKD